MVKQNTKVGIIRMRIAKVDKNQPEIVAALRKVGAVVKHTHTIKNLFDILVFHKGKIYCVEIKDSKQPKSKKRLTPGEEQCRSDMESVGVKYWVIESIEEALEMINVK
jgi:hypothetical protein